MHFNGTKKEEIHRDNAYNRDINQPQGQNISMSNQLPGESGHASMSVIFELQVKCVSHPQNHFG